MLKYKIYINESPLWLLPSDHPKLKKYLSKTLIHAKYRGQKKMLFNYIDLLEKSVKHEGVVIHYEDVDRLFRDLKSLYTYIKAGGGVVRRDDGKILMIHRLGYWDLPKGKRDPGETLRQTALREVEEEVGFHSLEVEGRIGTTYHCFRTNSKRVMKKVNWYAMHTPNPDDLYLQYAESIDDAAWVDPIAFRRLKIKSYKSVQDIIRRYRKKYIGKPKRNKERKSKEA